MMCCECKSHNIVSNETETYCADCGVVLSDEVFDSRGRRAYNNEEYLAKTQHGAPENIRLHDKGLPTLKQPQLKTLHIPKIANFTNNHNEKTLKFLFSENERITSQLKLSSNIKEESAFLLRKLLKETNLRSLKLELVAGAAIYLASKHLGQPRTRKEILGKIDYRGDRTFKRALKRFKKVLAFTPVFFTAEDYLPRFVSNLGLDYSYEQQAKQKLKELDFNGTNSRVKAITAIYLVLNEQEGQKKRGLKKYVSEKCGISPPTLRLTLKRLKL